MAADNGKGIFGVLMAIFIAVVTLGTQTIQLFFNVSFIASSFSQFFPGVINLDDVLKNIQLSVELIPELNIIIPFHFLLPFGAIVQQVLKLVEIVRLIAAAWPCHGGLTVVALALFGFSAKRILGIVAGETMFKMAIKSQSVVNHSNVVLKKLYLAITKLSVFMVFYIVQIFVFFFQNAVSQVMNSYGKGFLVPVDACSEADLTTWWIGIIFFMLYLISFIILYLAVFSGSTNAVGLEPTNPFENASLGKLIRGLVRLIREITPTPAKLIRSLKLFFDIRPERIFLLTLGIWSEEMTRVYGIKEKAERFDNDDTDDDNQQENVMVLLARSYSLLYIAFPGMVLFAKTQEFMNQSILIATGDGISLYTHAGKRFFLWVFNVTRLVFMFWLLFSPSPLAAFIMLASLIPPFLFQLIADIAAAVSHHRTNSVAPSTSVGP